MDMKKFKQHSIIHHMVLPGDEIPFPICPWNLMQTITVVHGKRFTFLEIAAFFPSRVREIRPLLSEKNHDNFLGIE